MGCGASPAVHSGAKQSDASDSTVDQASLEAAQQREKDAIRRAEEAERKLREVEKKLRQTGAKVSLEDKIGSQSKAAAGKTNLVKNGNKGKESKVQCLGIELVDKDSPTWDHLCALFRVPDRHNLGKGRDVQPQHEMYNDIKPVIAWKLNLRGRKALYDVALDIVKDDLQTIGETMECLPEVTTLLDASSELLGGLDTEVNEKRLLHGTKPQNLLAILRNGLNEKFSSGLLGSGLYLAENASKIDQYCTADKCPTNQEVDAAQLPYAKVVGDDVIMNMQIKEGDVIVALEEFNCDSESEKCIFQNQVGIVQSLDEDGDALIDFPMYEDESLWVRMCNFNKISKVAYKAGDAIVVTQDFKSDDETPISLSKLQGGVIEQVDEEGDMMINFQGYETMAWVFRHNFDKLSKVNIKVADEVVVLQHFKSDSGTSVELLTGQRGIVTEIDEEGDAQIDFEDHVEEKQWVRKGNFGKLNVKASLKLEPGDEIVVMESFPSDSEDEAMLLKGQRGTVDSVDADSALIDFIDHSTMKWVRIVNFAKLKKSSREGLYDCLYTQFGVEHPGNVFYSLVCRAVLGMPIYTKDGQTNMNDPFQNVFADSSKRELTTIAQCDSPILYHSLIAESGPKSQGHILERHREFCIFHSERILEEYVVGYQRLMNPAKS